MTAIIIQFPTAAERAERELAHMRSAELYRILEDGRALGEDLQEGKRAAAELARRLSEFEKAVAAIAADRPDELEEMVVLVGGMQIELGILPAMLMHLNAA